MQYFYLVTHDIVGDDVVVDKVFLNEHQAISWGRREATKHRDMNFGLYKQPITRTGVLKWVTSLKPYPLEISEKANFDWEEFFNSVSTYRVEETIQGKTIGTVTNSFEEVVNMIHDQLQGERQCADDITVYLNGVKIGTINL